MISVVIPLYNKAETVERAVRSVLAQTVSDFELIVVNNGSTDGSEEVVRKISDNRLRLVEQDNQGVSMARNRGVSESNGDLVTFLDADDEWNPTFLETVLTLNKDYPQCSVFATAYRRCDANGKFQDITLKNIPDGERFELTNYFEVAATSDPPFCSISVMVRKDVLLSIGGFPKGIHQGEDLLTWARLAAGNRIAYCRIPQSIFYTGENTVMDKPKRIPSVDDIVGDELVKIYERQPELNGLKEYIAHWYKMRASIYLRLKGYGRQCRAEIRKSNRWHGNKKMILYMLLSCLPYSIRMKLLQLV